MWHPERNKNYKELDMILKKLKKNENNFIVCWKK